MSRRELKTIVFIDYCGYSAYTDAHGDGAGVEAYLRLRTTVESSAAATDVVVVKWTGDGAMLAADDATAALTCVYTTMVAMRACGPLALRAGAITGTVRRVPFDELDYLGSVVNRAARLCSQAAPWQVRVGGFPPDRVGIHFTLRAA